MIKKYDVVIVGAGPAGAMAAKTAGENGLKAAILERKSDPAVITRGCAMMFAIESDYYFAERMYYNAKDRKMIFPVNGLTVDYNGPTRNFYAWHFYAPDGTTRMEFGNYAQSIAKGDKGRLSFVYDKGKLIGGLMDIAAKNGVDVFAGVNVDGIEKTAAGVRVTAGNDTFEGTFVIAADGLNSRIAALMGFNKDRISYGDQSSLTYYVKGLDIAQSEAVITANCFKADDGKLVFFWLIPSPYAKDEFWFSILDERDFDYITRQSVFSAWFSHMRLNRSLCCVSSMRSPVAEPYKDNVLLVGDAAWFAEAEITGSMLCGWKAANVITVALRDNKPDRAGVVRYIEWWQRSFPEFDDYRNFFMFVPFCFMFSGEELIYLYGLFKSPLRASLNPFRVVRNVKAALEPMMEQIQQEMPAVAEKLAMLEVRHFEKITRNLQFF